MMSKIRIGIIGAGGRGVHAFGHGLVQGHQDDAQVVAFADTNLDRARMAAKWLKLDAEVFEDPADMCQRTDIDAVVITTPDYLHEEHSLIALRHGKHVLVDKPLATTVDGCLRVIEAARKADRLLYMGFNLRHHALIQKIKSLVDQGVFGELFSIQAIEHYKGGRTYHSRWNRLKKFSGGLWIHKGSHDFDVINYFMGDVRPVSVACFASVFNFTPERLPFVPEPGIPVGPTCSDCHYRETCPDAAPRAYTPELGDIPHLFSPETAKVDGYLKDICMYTSEKDTHDQGIAIVNYENGATASHSEYFATPLSMRRYMIEGTRGHGESDMERNVHVYPRWGGGKATHELPDEKGGHGGADPKMIREFIGCIKNGSRPSAGGIDGTWAVAVAVAAEKSRETNQVVMIKDLMDPTCDLLKPQ